MGQKVNPIGFRVGLHRTWDSRWFADKDYADLLHKDLALRSFLRKRLQLASVSRILIERPNKQLRITVCCSRPGIVIGKKGVDIERLRAELVELSGTDVSFNVSEVRRPEIEAHLVAESVAQQLERRASFRRAMKKAMQLALKGGAQGIRINCSGRLGGAEIARMEWYREGRVPLHTLRADIDYGVATAKTTYGTCGVKVLIYRGDVIGHGSTVPNKALSSVSNARSAS